MRIDRSMRELYLAADEGDALMIASHAFDVYEDWMRLNMETRARLRVDSLFSSLPSVEHLAPSTGALIVAAWATLQGITQTYRLVDRETGEFIILPMLHPEENDDS